MLRRFNFIVTAAFVLAMFILVGIAPALGATACNPPAGTVARTVNGGGTVACKNGTVSPCAGMLVNADGYWHACPVAAPVETVYCPQDLGLKRWGACDNDPRGSYTGTDHILRGIESGRNGVIRNLRPGYEGWAAFACVTGQWEPRDAICNSPVTPATSPPASTPRPRAGDAKVGPVPRR